MAGKVLDLFFPVEDYDLKPEYTRVDGNQTHWTRKKQILAKYPEIGKLPHVNRMSGVYTVLMVGSLIVASYLLNDSNVFLLLAIAYFFGTIISHSLWVLIHEYCHYLVFQSKFWNNIFLLIADIPHVFPSAVTFGELHRYHHSFLNETYDDPDVPVPIENSIFGTSSLGKLLWMFFFPLIMALRQAVAIFYLVPPDTPKRFKLTEYHAWIAMNWIVNFSCDFVIFYFFGWKALLFLFISFFFGIGLHPLGARWVAEHYAIHPDQETYSYYGCLNFVCFNIGFHNEHHDFPTIPWNLLPTLKKIAPEYYVNLRTHKSYVRLLIDFICKPEFTLCTRVVRDSHKIRNKKNK